MQFDSLGLSERMIKFDGLSQTADSDVHVIHIVLVWDIQ